MICDDTSRLMIPPHYTCTLQPCDIGINKPLKERLKRKGSHWRRAKIALLVPGEKFHHLPWKEVLTWLQEIWQEFLPEIVNISFSGSGYACENNVIYNRDTESDDEILIIIFSYCFVVAYGSKQFYNRYIFIIILSLIEPEELRYCQNRNCISTVLSWLWDSYQVRPYHNKRNSHHQHITFL